MGSFFFSCFLIFSLLFCVCVCVCGTPNASARRFVTLSQGIRAHPLQSFKSLTCKSFNPKKKKERKRSGVNRPHILLLLLLFFSCAVLFSEAWNRNEKRQKKKPSLRSRFLLPMKMKNDNKIRNQIIRTPRRRSTTEKNCCCCCCCCCCCRPFPL